MLVVDDSALMRTVIADVIAGFADFDVVGTARDGHDALEKIHALDPDIVTLDIEMPGLDGIATLGYVMSETPRAVVMLSAAGSTSDVDLTLRALELGAVDFIRKPDAGGAQKVRQVADRLHAALRAASVVNLKGVPMLDLGTGLDLVNGGRAAGKKLSDDYTEHRYHQVSDKFDPKWDWSGMAEDAVVMADLATEVANSDKWPSWYKTSEFKAIRDASLKVAK